MRAGNNTDNNITHILPYKNVPMEADWCSIKTLPVVCITAKWKQKTIKKLASWLTIMSYYVGFTFIWNMGVLEIRSQEEMGRGSGISIACDSICSNSIFLWHFKLLLLDFSTWELVPTRPFSVISWHSLCTLCSTKHREYFV